jgi:hypothetical protein
MVIDDCTQRLFGQPLVTNIVRGTFVEAMINLALRDTGWRQCIAWAGWDFEHDSTRLEVRQAASRQPWDKARKISDREIKFDITPRTGHWAVEGFVEDHSTARLANLYLFAHHEGTDASADHREPARWQFYVVPETALPQKPRVFLKAVQDLAKTAVGIADLSARICDIEGQL